MFKNKIIQRTAETNNDVPNTACTAKQDCSDIVHISIFFDGTGNNKEADEAKKQWSNPARLWRNGAQYSLDDVNIRKNIIKNNYPIYVSGVGTRFNGELNIFQRALANVQDSFLGLGVGTGGTRRLDYGEDQLNDALKQVLIANAQKVAIDTRKYANEKKVSTFAEVNKSLGDHRLIKKINLSIFGFSRGAALARAFTNDFMWKCNSDCDGFTYGEYPIEFKFLGIFDTVASFGLPATNLNNNVTFTGRDLVVDERVKKCVHHIAGNELRFAFPVDLIHKDNGELANPNWKEVVYPGMHSDVGGGYTPGDQQVSDNFARIPLKDMLEEAVNAGVRLYSYEELKEKNIRIFEQQFEIKKETQQLYTAVRGKMSSTGTIQDQIKDSMKLYYSAYGSLARAGKQSVSQKARADHKTVAYYNILGPRDMATEMARLEKWQQKVEKKEKGINFLRVFSPVSTAYQYSIAMHDWAFESWHKNVDNDVMDFYQNYIHDSKYGFMSNVEPFSYFRQRTVYESRRSGKGKEVDQKIAKDKAICSVGASNFQQKDIAEAYKKAKGEFIVKN